MSKREQLNDYIRQLQNRLRLQAGLRGAAVIAATALIATVALALVLNHYAFAERGINPARLSLLFLLVVAIGFGLAWPLLRLTRGRSVGKAENGFPEFEQRLLTFSERDAQDKPDPFVELLAADTL